MSVTRFRSVGNSTPETRPCPSGLKWVARFDGNYTACGGVITGLAIVDRIQEGDVIASVVMHPRAPTRRPR